MDPQTHPIANKFAQWVNDAPTLAASADRYNQIIRGQEPSSDIIASISGLRH